MAQVNIHFKPVKQNKLEAQRKSEEQARAKKETGVIHTPFELLLILLVGVLYDPDQLS